MVASGDEVPGYRLRGLLDRAPQRRLHRAEALGRPGRPLLVEVRDTPLDEQQLLALRTRCAAVAELGHPAILPVQEVVALEKGVALVMPAGVGGSLADALSEAGAGGLDAATVTAVSGAVTGALRRAHARGIHHGAITAEVVRFDHQGRPLLLGLGTDALRSVVYEAADAADAAERDLRDVGDLLATCRAGAASGTTAVRPVPDRPDGARKGGPLPNAHRSVTQRPSAAIRTMRVLAAVGVLVMPLLLVAVAVAGT